MLNLFHNPYGGNYHGQQKVFDELLFAIGILYSNLLRTSGLNLIVPNEEINHQTQDAIYRLLGNEIDNPASTWIGSKFQMDFTLSEDTSSNPYHYILIY